MTFVVLLHAWRHEVSTKHILGLCTDQTISWLSLIERRPLFWSAPVDYFPLDWNRSNGDLTRSDWSDRIIPLSFEIFVLVRFHGFWVYLFILVVSLKIMFFGKSISFRLSCINSINKYGSVAECVHCNAVLINNAL